MGAMECNAVPDDFTNVETVGKDAIDCPSAKGIASAGKVALFVSLPGCGGHVLPTVIGLKKEFHNRVGFLIDYERLSFTDSVISQTWGGLVSGSEGFFCHSSNNFPGEVKGIVFVKPFNDGFDKPSEHSVHNRFRNTLDVYAAFLA